MSPTTTPFQVASLVNAPSFPNAVVWSDDNLIAVANGDIVTILNPENVQGPRGVITVSTGLPFKVGVIKRDDLLSGCLLPTCLARDRQPCVRSIAWSPVGYTPHNGCLLAVCTTEGRVKIYREPFCEFQAEWIEVMDISDVLHKYLEKTNYGEPLTSLLPVMDESVSQTLAEDGLDITNFTPIKEDKRKRVLNAYTQKIDPTYDVDLSESNVINFAAKGKKTSNKRTLDNHTGYVLKAHQYASRSSMLASLVVGWSPVMQLSADDPNNSCDFFCLLGVGTKYGSISIWKFDRPSYYSIDQHGGPIQMVLKGVLEAHSAWVTSLSWVLLPSGTSSQVLLATGCSNGSVKIWMAYICDFKSPSEANQTPFSLFCEISVGDNALVSTLSLCIPAQSRDKILVAVGKGSGSFEVWSFDRKTNSPKKVGSYDAHVQAVTGLAWALDGHCLYSCSQDNSIHGWIHHKGTLFKASIPPNNLGTRSSSDLPSVSDSSYGIAVSPANLALAVARRFDAGQLDHMYQKRTQRASVEFFWIGGQEFNMSLDINLSLDIDSCSGFTKEELVIWGSKLLWSLNLYESSGKHLVAWDVLSAILAFKQCAPKFIHQIIRSWVELLLEGYLDSSTHDILSDLPGYMPQISSRQLHMLNILCRRVMLSTIKPSKVAERYDIEEEEKWLNIMLNSEKELRERLVGLSLSTVLVCLSHPAGNVEFGLWGPVGIAQMVKWVMQNQDHVDQKLYVLAAEVRGHVARLHNVCDYKEEEHCLYCSAPVPFESPEEAFCEGVQCGDGEAPQKHKLARCAASMQVCPLTPLWFCMCCRRRVSKVPPYHLHNMVDRPSDFGSLIKSVVKPLPNPLCPFCGISLQRLQPDFLLSKSPV
ncbi:uncharacterized protein LOC141656775 [Silene latifolia]|uniref:uncharacterized protein LOC141656775 n=1 Tax=Silene latifolia TaxID=37657 RepID=UPI003D7720C9